MPTEPATEDHAPDPELFVDQSPDAAADVGVAVICDHLQEAGVHCVIVSYSGSGDSGGVEDWAYAPADARPRAELLDKLKDLASDWLDVAGISFNNEGGHGQFTIWPQQMLVEMEDYENVVEVESEELGELHLTPTLLAQLTEAGVTRFEGSWDGQDDSGQVSLDYYAGDEVLTGDKVSDALNNSVEELIGNHLPVGCEINEGSCADISCNLESAEITLDFYNRVESDSEPEYTRWKLMPDEE